MDIKIDELAKKADKFEKEMEEIYEKLRILETMSNDFDFSEFFSNEIEPMIRDVYILYRYPFDSKENYDRIVIEFRDGISIEWYDRNEIYVIVSERIVSLRYILANHKVLEIINRIISLLGFE